MSYPVPASGSNRCDQQGPPVISHVFIGTNDFDRAFAFYSLLMNELGLVLKFCDADKPRAGWDFLIWSCRIVSRGEGRDLSIRLPSE